MKNVQTPKRRKKSKLRLWRHPNKGSIQVPYRDAMALAVMQMGLSDYAVIAAVTRLTVEDVKRIDMMEDASIRQLWREGLPDGEFFKLYETVRCPKCRATTIFAPCVSCTFDDSNGRRPKPQSSE